MEYCSDLEQKLEWFQGKENKDKVKKAGYFLLMPLVDGLLSFLL